MLFSAGNEQLPGPFYAIKQNRRAMIRAYHAPFERTAKAEISLAM